MEHLIPQAWFDDLAQVWLLVIAAVSVAVLGKGADWLVEGASGLAYRIGMSKVIVGATVVSLGTTSPECAVSVMAAWQGHAGLALGNAVGSIIADTTLIFGVGCLLTALPADRYVLSRQGWVQFGAGLLLAGLCYGKYWFQGKDAELGWLTGAALLALLGVYMWVSVVWSKRHPHGEPFQTPDDVAQTVPITPASEQRQRQPGAVGIFLVMMVVGLFLVILSSRVLICSVTVLAGRWGVPQVVIASTIVALGTSLPELVVGIASIFKGHAELLVGNIIGADILNVLFVVGASAAAARLPIVEDGQTLFLTLHLPVMIAALLIMRVYVFGAVRRGQFSRWMGIPMLSVYVLYVVSQFVLGAGVMSSRLWIE